VSPPASLAEAKRLVTIDPARAAALAEAVLRVGRSDTAQLLLATARRRAGDWARALEAVAPLAWRLPGAWGVQFEHGMALSAAGETPAAIAALRRARAIKPDATLATHALWDLAMVSGEAEAGLPRPDLSALSSSEVTAAVATFLTGGDGGRSALAERWGLDPNDCAAACLLAEIGLRHGRGEAVVALMTATIRLAPGHRPARFRLAQALHRRSDDAAALDVLAPLLAGPACGAAVLGLQGSVLMALNRAEEAQAAYEHAAALTPADPRVHLAHGHALRVVGLTGEAVSAYREALARAPACAEAWGSIADLKSGALTEADVAAMARLLGEAIPPAARSHLHFATGRALEDAGRFDEAFGHYREGNRLRRAAEPFDIPAHEAAVKRAIRLCTPDFLAARAGWGDPTDAPVFVVGMPRSGSTLVEQILAGHSAIESAGELPDLPIVARALAADALYPDVLEILPAEAFARAGRDYLARSATRRRNDQPRFVDKFPGNAFHLPLILLALPNARIIDVRRDPLDCCVSLFAQSFAGGQTYSYDLADLGRHYASYARMVDHLRELLPDRIFQVRYEDVVGDLEGETRRMLDHLRLEFEQACLRFNERTGPVRTASSEQVRRPLYRSSIGRWRRFEAYLAPLVEALGPRSVRNDGRSRADP
jgi:tetratricopeptide (TPR) repeat protein